MINKMLYSFIQRVNISWFLLLGCLAGILIAPCQTHAQDGAEEVRLLWPDGAPGAKGDSTIDKPAMTVFLPEKSKANGTGVVIFPGGGYTFVAMKKEGFQVARWFNSLGVAAFVVKYRLGMRYHYPAEYLDGQRAMQMARKNAKKWNVDPNRIGVAGFSAGGHMASTVGTHFKKGDPGASDPYKHYSTRPDFMVLIYPVITMKKSFTHNGSRTNLLGKNPDPELVRKMSNETQVTAETPPTFLVHASNDGVVPVKNSVEFYMALRKAGVPAEMHLYEDGPHGFGLAQKYPLISSWPDLCRRWLVHEGLIPEVENQTN